MGGALFPPAIYLGPNYGGHNENKLKWTGMGEFNSDDQYIYYSGKDCLRRNGVAIIVNKEAEISKMTE